MSYVIMTSFEGNLSENGRVPMACSAVITNRPRNLGQCGKVRASQIKDYKARKTGDGMYVNERDRHIS